MITGIIIVDHGSRSERSNALLETVVYRFSNCFADRFPIVEGAHMELQEPSLKHAFARCVDRGADHVIVVPFFLAPGKHMTSDIPRLAIEAAEWFPGTSVQIADPLGCDDLLVQLLGRRAEEALHQTPAHAIPNNHSCSNRGGKVRPQSRW